MGSDGYATRIGRVVLLTLVLVLAACAAPIQAVDAQLAPLPAGQSGRQIQLQREAVVQLSTGRRRPLAMGSRWDAVGKLPQGVVYRPTEGSFLLVGRDVHEAYLVIQDSVLQGFYLPGESRYSPLSPALPLSIGVNS
jgi:hypothetical protein